MTKTITINEKEFPTYCTLDEANEYFATKLNSSAWDDLTEDDRKKVLIEVTRKLNCLKYKGFPVAINQPLAFPRYFKINYLSKRTYTAEANAIKVHGKELIYIEAPEEMIAACCEEALNTIALGSTTNSVHIKNQKMGISSVSIMGDSVSYTGNGGSYTGSATDTICFEALCHIDKFLMNTARVV